MKKFIPIALGLTILCAVPAFATSDSIDVKSLDDTALQTLYTNARDELLSRGLTTGDEIGAGAYVVGKDIGAGTYRYTFNKDDIVTLFIYENEDDYNNNGDSRSASVSQGESTDLTLTDGMVIDIRKDGGSLESSNPSWAVTDES